MTKKQKLAKLLRRLKRIPDEQFDYHYFFVGEHVSKADGIFLGDWKGRYPCGTCGCVAGHTVLMFRLKARTRDDKRFTAVGDVAKRYLRLTNEEAEFLFYKNVAQADKQSAIERLEHLISGTAISAYSIREEIKRYYRRNLMI